MHWGLSGNFSSWLIFSYLLPCIQTNSVPYSPASMSAANRRALYYWLELLSSWGKIDWHWGNSMIAELQVVSMKDFAALDWNVDKQVWMFSVDDYFTGLLLHGHLYYCYSVGYIVIDSCNTWSHHGSLYTKPHRRLFMKNDVKSKVVAKKWQANGKLLRMTIQCCLLHISLGFGTK